MKARSATFRPVTTALAGRHVPAADRRLPLGGGGGFFSPGRSDTMASVVMRRPATEAASCSAVRTTLAGSTMPASIMSTYSSVWALKPQLFDLCSLTLPTTIEPSAPEFLAIWRMGESAPSARY